MGRGRAAREVSTMMNRTSSALLILDMQNDLVRGHRKLGDGEPNPRMDTVIARIALVRERCREAGVPVIYTQVCYRPGYIDAPANAPARQHNTLLQGSEGAGVIPELAPQGDDVVILKRRVGAFHGTDLEIVLDGLGVGRVVVAGMSTPRAVESTVREAHSLGIACVVLEDGTYAADDETQEFCLRILRECGFASTAASADVILDGGGEQ
jgi:nicotinamidase-related amidase